MSVKSRYNNLTYNLGVQQLVTEFRDRQIKDNSILFIIHIVISIKDSLQ